MPRAPCAKTKAETFAALMAQPHALASRAANDPVLAAKIALLKQRLLAYCRACDDAFWDRIASATTR